MIMMTPNMWNFLLLINFTALVLMIISTSFSQKFLLNLKSKKKFIFW